MRSTLSFKAYIGISFVYLLLIILEREDISWFLKPFLIPFLFLAVYTCGDFPSKKFLLIALTFSWIGDVVLMFADKGELYFIVGLASFLISHIAYIILFSKQLRINSTRNKAVFWVGITVIIVYLMAMLSVLLPSLGDLKIPVFVYAIVLSTMLLFAFKGYLKWSKPAGMYILLGAVIFVSSDSIMAFDKFYEPLKFSSFLIMSTYIAAQYLIVVGILKLNKKK
ncbi:putative membrane protein YhhN [Flavobacterium sp. CG_23.5]|uniref:lysoplasmalogenase n=1 Tax=Flavobacterium sp. CG_23.5 TaxID=2760708 RepID=UPI001AE55484|nr:lysoplasmalogenase [Flavobacterium sp. CG_23.5]MBP2281854.1 putative membrane protein YhhN [Flavobacterium sp. CG_23.5]